MIGNNYRIQWISRPAKKLLFGGKGTFVGKVCAQALKGVACSARCFRGGEMISPSMDGNPFGPVCLEDHIGATRIQNNILRDSKGTPVGLLKRILPGTNDPLGPTSENDEGLESSALEEDGAWTASFNSTLPRVARTTIPVLLVGETGTGKEVLAHRIHRLSSRRNHPFVVLDLSVVPDTLIDDSLFGHARGAFTGATSDYTGKLVQADGGTLFLDELENIPLSVQAKLLRFLETGIIERIGKNQITSVDVRILAATNVDPQLLLRTGRLREDLYFRLRGLTVEIPPLRKRKEEIPHLLRSFRKTWEEKNRQRASDFDTTAIERFMNYSYPGNIRELRHLVDLCLALSHEQTISDSNLPAPVRTILVQSDPAPPLFPDPSFFASEPEPMSATISTIERKMIQKVLEESQGRISEAARTLSMSRITLWRKMRKYGLDKRNPLNPERLH